MTMAASKEVMNFPLDEAVISSKKFLAVDDVQQDERWTSLKGTEYIRSWLGVTSEEDIQVVAEAENGREAIEQVRIYQPDVIVMDFSMPGLNSLEGTRSIIKSFPEVRVLVLTMHTQKEYILQFIRAGAAGYLPKDSTATDLIDAIRQILICEKFISPSHTDEELDDLMTQLKQGKLKSPLELWSHSQIGNEKCYS